MYLLDTNIVSELRRGSRQVSVWMQTAPKDRLWLSVVTLAEIKRGIIMQARKDAAAANALEVWLQTLRNAFSDRILPVDEAVAIEWGRIAALRTRGVPDCQIAATAIVHGLVLVTRNIIDFEDIGVPLVNPWRPV